MKPFSHYIETKISAQTEIEKPSKSKRRGRFLDVALLPGLDTLEVKPVSPHSSL